MRGSTDQVDRSTVYDRIDRVTDPELDESIVELQYVDRVRIDGTAVDVRFRLPTAWCSPAFAWMMATGIRDEVGGIAAVDDVRVELADHMHSEEINRGVNRRMAFEEVFDDAESDVEAVRRELDRKARLSRQYRAMSALLDAGVRAEQIARLRRADLAVERPADDGEPRATVAVADGALYVTVPADPVEEYVAKAEQTAAVAGPDDRLFKTPEGEPIDDGDEEFEQTYARTRLANSNMSGQGGICAQLNESRYDDVTAEKAD